MAYNDDQAGRPVRQLCTDVVAMAASAGERPLDPGAAGPLALDLGCGAGVETAALLRAGWRVHAIDSAPGTAERVLRTVEQTSSSVDRGLGAAGLTVEVADLRELASLPGADLVHAGYALPYLPPDDFARVWSLIRRSLRPGGWLAVDLLGDRDSWAGTPDETFLDEASVRGLLTGLDVLRFEVEDADGPAYRGSKHWHVFHVIARARLSANRPSGSVHQ